MSHEDHAPLRPEQLQAERLTREQVAVYLSMSGFPITLSTLEKLCAPAIGDGPPVEMWWGRRRSTAPSSVSHGRALVCRQRQRRRRTTGRARPRRRPVSGPADFLLCVLRPDMAAPQRLPSRVVASSRVRVSVRCLVRFPGPPARSVCTRAATLRKAADDTRTHERGGYRALAADPRVRGLRFAAAPFASRNCLDVRT